MCSVPDILLKAEGSLGYGSKWTDLGKWSIMVGMMVQPSEGGNLVTTLPHGTRGGLTQIEDGGDQQGGNERPCSGHKP